MGEAAQGVAIMATPSGGKRSAGGTQTAVSLPLELLPGWLFGVTASKVKPELRDKIIRYQRECFRVLWRAFQAEALAVMRPAVVTREVLESVLEAERTIYDQKLKKLKQEIDNKFDNAEIVLNFLMRDKDKSFQSQTGHLITFEQQKTIRAKIAELVLQIPPPAPPTEDERHWQILKPVFIRFGVPNLDKLTKDQYDLVIAYLDGWAARK